MITVTLNGETKSLKPGTTVSSLLEHLGLNRPGIAVAVDHRVVARSEHPTYVITDNAQIEVIRAVGGG